MYKNYNAFFSASESRKQNLPRRTLDLPFLFPYKHITCLKNHLLPAPGESYRSGFQLALQLLVVNYWLRKFLCLQSLIMKCNQGQNQTLIVKRQSCTFVTIIHFPIMHFPSLFLPIMHFVIMHFAIMHFPIMHFPIVHFEFNSLFIHALIKIIVYLKDILALFNHTLSNLTVLSNLTPSATIMQNSEITQPLSET